MSGNTFGHLFRFTTFGESHGAALGCVVDGVPPRIPPRRRRHPGAPQPAPARRIPVHQPAPRTRSGENRLRRVRRRHHRRAHRAHHHQRGRPVQGLRHDQGQVPPRARGLHLPPEVRRPRPPGRRAGQCPRNRHARGRRRRRPQGAGRRGRDPRRPCPDGTAPDRPRALGLGGGGKKSLLVPRRGNGQGMGNLPRRRAQSGRVHGRGDRGGGGGRSGGPGGAGLGQARRRHRQGPDEYPGGQGRRDRRRLRGRRTLGAGELRRDAHRPDGKATFLSNNAGGVLGGISTGQNIVARFVVKPTTSVSIPQKTIDTHGQEVEIATKGRHDPCVGIRAVAVGEAMVACVLADHLLRHKAQCGG